MRLLTLGLVLTGAAALACTQQTGGMSAEDEATAIAAIEQLMYDELATIMAGDMEAHRMLISDDILMMPPGEPMTTGAEATMAGLEDFLANADFTDARYITNNISIHGDVAIHQFTGEWTVVLPDGETMHETSKGIHVLERQDDGSWVIAMDVWNTDTPPGGDTEEM